MARYRGLVKKLIDERLSNVSFTDFFLTVGVSVSLGLIMALFDSQIAFVIIMTMSSSVGGTAFMLFFIPKLINAFKKQPPQKAVGEDLAIGAHGERPKPAEKMRIVPYGIDM